MHNISAINFSKVYFLKNAKKTAIYIAIQWNVNKNTLQARTWFISHVPIKGHYITTAWKVAQNVLGKIIVMVPFLP